MVVYCHSAWDIKHFMVCMQGQSWWLGASLSSLPHPSWNCALLLLPQWRTVLRSRAENLKTSANFKEVPYEEHLTLLKEWFCKNCYSLSLLRNTVLAKEELECKILVSALILPGFAFELTQVVFGSPMKLSALNLSCSPPEEASFAFNRWIPNY